MYVTEKRMGVDGLRPSLKSLYFYIIHTLLFCYNCWSIAIEKHQPIGGFAHDLFIKKELARLVFLKV